MTESTVQDQIVLRFKELKLKVMAHQATLLVDEY